MTVLADEVRAAEVEGYVEVTDEQANEIAMLKAARKNTAAWEARRDELNAKIKNLLAGAKGALHNGRVLAEVSERGGRRSVDLDLLKARWPEAYAACVSEGKRQKVLSLK